MLQIRPHKYMGDRSYGKWTMKQLAIWWSEAVFSLWIDDFGVLMRLWT